MTMTANDFETGLKSVAFHIVSKAYDTTGQAGLDGGYRWTPEGRSRIWRHAAHRIDGVMMVAMEFGHEPFSPLWTELSKLYDEAMSNS